MEEAVSGVKGELAVKLFGRDLKTLEQKADEMQGVMSQIPGIADLGTFQVRGQPNVNLVVDRAAADRFGINVSDIQDAVETRGRRQGRQPDPDRRTTLRLDGALPAAVPQDRGRHRQHSDSRAIGRARGAEPGLPHHAG